MAHHSMSRLCLALCGLIMVASAWEYDPDLMANPNFPPMQGPVLPNYGMDPLGVFQQPLALQQSPALGQMQFDQSLDFDPQLMPLPANRPFAGAVPVPFAPRFMEQPTVTTTVLPNGQAETQTTGENPDDTETHITETRTITTATPIDDSEIQAKRERMERRERERREREERRKKEREEEREHKKKEREEREERRRQEKEEREEKEKQEREEREAEERKRREEHERHEREVRERREKEDKELHKRHREEDRDDRDEEGGDDRRHHHHHHHRHHHRRHRCHKHRDGEDGEGEEGGEGEKKESEIQSGGKTIKLVVHVKKEKGDDKDGGDDEKCDKCEKDDKDCNKDQQEEEEEGEEKEDPVMAQKKKEYEELSEKLAEREKEFQKEAEWLTKTLSVVNELKQKSHNVQMHLNDMHREMVLLESKRQVAAKELEDAQGSKKQEEALHRLEKQLETLMSASSAANEQIGMLAQRKARYLAKIGELKNVLQDIKLKSLMKPASSSYAPPPPPAQQPQMDVVAQDEGCDCAVQGPHNSGCGCY